MALHVTIELPKELERKLRQNSADLNAEVKEAYALELFRRRMLTHFELAQILGLDQHETDSYLKRLHIVEGSLSMDDLEADRQTLERVMSKAR